MRHALEGDRVQRYVGTGAAKECGAATPIIVADHPRFCVKNMYVSHPHSPPLGAGCSDGSRVRDGIRLAPGSACLTDVNAWWRFHPSFSGKIWG